MGKKLMPKAICKTVCRRVVHWQVVKLPHTDLGTWLATQVHGSTLRPGQGGVCPPPSLQGASTLQQQGSDASTHTDNGDDDDREQDNS
jgi:hypothetical protein